MRNIYQRCFNKLCGHFSSALIKSRHQLGACKSAWWFILIFAHFVLIHHWALWGLQKAISIRCYYKCVPLSLVPRGIKGSGVRELRFLWVVSFHSLTAGELGCFTPAAGWDKYTKNVEQYRKWMDGWLQKAEVLRPYLHLFPASSEGMQSRSGTRLPLRQSQSWVEGSQ